MESLGVSLTCSTIAMSVVVSVAVSKTGIILHQINQSLTEHRPIARGAGMRNGLN